MFKQHVTKFHAWIYWLPNKYVFSFRFSGATLAHAGVIEYASSYLRGPCESAAFKLIAVSKKMLGREIHNC